MYVFSLRELMFTLTFAKTNYALHVYMRYVRTMLFNLSHIHVICSYMYKWIGILGRCFLIKYIKSQCI